MSMDETLVRKTIRTHLMRDLLFVAVLAAAVFTLGVWLDLFEKWAEMVRAYEQYEFDEWAWVSLVMAIAFGVLFLGRWWQREKLNARLAALYRTAQLVSSALDSREVLRQVVEATRDILKYSHVVVMMIQEGRLVPMAWAGYSERPPELRLDQGVTGRVARTGKTAFVPEVSLDPDFVPATYGTTSEIACPITVDGQMVGVLSVESVQNMRLRPEDVELVSSLALQLGLALHNALQHEHTLEQAIRDGLTGLYNHTYFHERIGEELSRAGRYGRPFSLVMLDLDNFKSLNDTYGHSEGDRILRAFAEVIRRAVRESDLPARYGGEEFAIMMPETRGQEAAIAAERLRRQLERGHLLRIDGVDICLTASFGVAAFPEDADDAPELIRRADEALYAAKRSGKNQVHVAHSEPRKQVLEAW